MPEALANMDFSNIEGDLEQDDYYEENGFDLQNASYFKNLKIGDYNLDQLDDIVNQGEKDLE